MNAANPLIVQSDPSVLLGVAASDAAQARAELARFAESETAPEHLHTYRITPLSLSLWNAAVTGLDPDEVVAVLVGGAKYPVVDVHDPTSRYGQVWLTRDADGLVLATDSDILLDESGGVRTVGELLGKRLDDHCVPGRDTDHDFVTKAEAGPEI